MNPTQRLLFAAAYATSQIASASISVTSADFSYTQDFLTLPDSGTELIWNNNETIPGWYRDYYAADENVAPPFRDVSVQATGSAGSGVTSQDGFINIGIATNTPNQTDFSRALVMRRAFNLYGAIGVVFRNDSGGPLGGFTLGYTGEQWRRHGDGIATSLYVEYAVLPTDAELDIDTNPDGSEGINWTRIPELSFVSPNIFGGNSGVNGNLPENRTVIDPVAVNATVEEGSFLVIRWYQDRTNSDGSEGTAARHALGVDNISISMHAGGDTGVVGNIWESRPLVDGWRYTGAGWIYDADYPHVYDTALGWLYVCPNATSSDLYLYSHSLEAFIWMLPDWSWYYDFSLETWTAAETVQVTDSLHVASFGAVPDDGICDTEAINNAIQTAMQTGIRNVLFDAGMYELVETSSVSNPRNDNYIGIFYANDLALIGAVDNQGIPATRLERKLELNNDTDPFHTFDVWYSNGVTIRNFILSNDPALGSTGRVISVNRTTDEVVIEVLEGLPAYDGMRAASAHVWDLSIAKLKRFGRTPSEATLNFGLNITDFWQAVPGTNSRQLRMTGSGWAAKVSVGDGITWHHSPVTRNQTEVQRCTDFTFDNIVMPNLSNMAMLAAYNENLVFRRIRLEPENGNLAVGARDGFHLSNNTGTLLFEDSYMKGLRMDPLVIRRTYGILQEIYSDGRIVLKPGFTIPVGDSLRFWVGDGPQDRAITSVQNIGDGFYVYGLDGELPDGATIGTAVNFQSFSLESGLIRNCVFEDSFGSPIVNFEENMTVEECVFNNNAYQIKYGPNSVSGGFVRNNIFRNNLIENSSWIDIVQRGSPASLLIHSISRFFDAPRYNKNIVITGNIFRNPDGDASHAAIDIRNATDVQIVDNVFEGFTQKVKIESATTDRIDFTE